MRPPRPPNKIASCSKNRCSIALGRQQYLNIRQECPNPLQGQVVTIAEIPAPPYFLLPQIFGVKKVSGCLVNLHFYLASYFKYMPNIIMEGGGQRINNKFVSGKWHAVSYFNSLFKPMMRYYINNNILGFNC